MYALYQKLIHKHGPQGWWPIKGKYYPGDYSIPRNDDEMLEIIIGAILTQNTAWKNVEKALANLQNEKLIDIEKMLKIPEKKLAQLIKPAGYFNQKAKKLEIMMAFLKKETITELKKQNAEELRKKLLALWGVGPETADSIILYAFKKPMFVVDVYTRRLLKKEGFITDEKMLYDALQKIITDQLGIKGDNEKVKIYNEFHALMVEEGKERVLAKHLKRKTSVPVL